MVLPLESFTKCQWVEPDNADAQPENRAMFYKGGPSPVVETAMGRSGGQAGQSGLMSLFT